MDWDDLKYAAEVVRAGTLTAAAAALGVNQTTVARRLTHLEGGLGFSLFVRVDGKLVPSKEGLQVLEKAAAVESLIAELLASLETGGGTPAGQVRLTAIDTFFTSYLVSKLPSFSQAYPNIVLELIGDGANLSLERQDVDIALRFSRPLTGDSIIRKIADVSFAVYASQAMIKEYGTSDFQALPWITYDSSLEHLPESRWITDNVPNAASSFRFNGGHAMRQAIKEGLGVGFLPCYFGGRDPGLTALSKPVVRRELWLLINGSLRRSARVDVVVEWLMGIFQQDKADFLTEFS